LHVGGSLFRGGGDGSRLPRGFFRRRGGFGFAYTGTTPEGVLGEREPLPSPGTPASVEALCSSVIRTSCSAIRWPALKRAGVTSSGDSRHNASACEAVSLPRTAASMISSTAFAFPGGMPYMHTRAEALAQICLS